MKGAEVVDKDQLCVDFRNQEDGLFTVTTTLVYQDGEIKADESAIQMAKICAPQADYTYLVPIIFILFAVIVLWKVQYNRMKRKYER